MRRTHRLVPALLVASLCALALAGCGDDDDPAEAAGGKPAPSSTTASSAPAAALDAHARSAAAARSGPAFAPKLLSKAGLASAAGFKPPAAGAGSLHDVGCFMSNTNGIDFTTAVDCSEPHFTEAFATIDMDDSWPDDIGAYEAGTETGTKWRAWAEAGCRALQQEAIGADPIAQALGLQQAYVTATGNFGLAFSHTPENEWDVQTHRTYCTVHATNDAPAVAGNWAQTLLSADRPVPFGICAGVDGDTYFTTTCDQQHYREEAFFFNAADAFDRSFLDSVDPADVTDDQWGAMDAVCAKSEALLLGQERDDLKMQANVGEGFWGDQAGWYPINCGIVPEDYDLDMVGSALGIGAGHAQLVPTSAS